MKKSKKQKRVTTQPTMRVDTSSLLHTTKTVTDYLMTLPQEERESLMKGSTMDVCEKSGASDRLSTLVAAYYHIHSIESLLQADIEILLDNWGLWLKGIKPAMTSVQQADAKFFRTMRDIFNKAVDDERRKANEVFYNKDVDSLYKRFMSWEGLPVRWEPGKPHRIDRPKGGDTTEDTLAVENDNEFIVIASIDAPDMTRQTTSYTVGKLLDGETVEMGKKVYDNLSTARGVATKYANSDAGEIYVIYERSNQWHYRPIEYRRKDNG